MSLKMQNASVARVENSFKQLASAAQALNTASDDLGKVTRQMDASLKRLALGLTAWVPVSGTSDETQYWTNELGYAKLDGKWGLALREVTGYRLDHDETEQVWAYNDAPRALRAEAVDKIPDLLEKMLQQTEETTRNLRTKIEQASELTLVVTNLVPTPPAVEPKTWNRLSAGESAAAGSEQDSLGGAKPAGRFRDGEALPTERAAAPAGQAAPSATPAPAAAGRFRETENRPLPVERSV